MGTVCRECKGCGKLVFIKQTAPGIYKQQISHCDKCNGTGSMTPEKCDVCDTQGILKIQKEIVIKIDKGSRGNMKIKYKGASNQAKGKKPGDS